MKNIILLILTLLLPFILVGQSDKVLKQANTLGNQWKFEQAIELLQNEIKSDPDNAELYYWLGRYSHYLVYDTRPFINKSNKWSEEMILKNFYKAVELNPNYGDAKYFIAVEHGARAYEALKKEDIIQYKQEYITAHEHDGLPDYILEYGRRLLKSCEKDAILIVDGDAQLNSIQYLQSIEGYRKDVSLIAYGLMERPSYVKFLRDGVKDMIRPVPMNWSDDAIMEMRNYKWQENIISIPLSEEIKKRYTINYSIKNFEWTVKPNIGKGKLWSATAVLIDIIETNKWERPIYWTMFGLNDISGFENNMQITGLVAKFVPKKVKGTPLEYDKEKFEEVMFNPNNYSYYNDLVENIQPRINGSVLHIPQLRFINYATFLYENGEAKKAEMVLDKIDELMPFSIFTPHKLTLDKIDALKSKINGAN